MPYFCQDSLKLHYTDSPAKDNHNAPAIIALHGLSESHLYWSLTGMVDKLTQAGFRVISLDMRGHGFTEVTSEDKGYNVQQLAADITRLADHLALEKFHLLSHATGGIVSFYYAIHNPHRVQSILATNTGSATYPVDQYCDVTSPDYVFPPLSESDQKRNRALSKGFRSASWGDIMATNRTYALQNPFLNNLPNQDNPETAFALYFACSTIGNPDNYADFIDEFYTSYDPQIAGLRTIACPVLILVGEHDRMFIKPAELIKREVPQCTHVVMPNTGHMTAIEAPEQLSQHLLNFLTQAV